MNWLKEKLAGLVLAGTLAWLRHKHVHLIDTSDGLDYFGEGRVIGGRLNRDPDGAITGISILWMTSGTTTPDYRHFPLESLSRHKALGLVIDRA